MNYHHLLYFKTIAEEGTVSKAAAKLYLGQPTLSAQLKQFEDHLGVKLFERQHKKLILTEQGKVALDYARQIFKLGSEMTEVLNDNKIPSRTHLQIASLDSIPKELILALTKAAYKINTCQISLIEGKSHDIFHELLSHRVDLVVTNFIPTTGEGKFIHPKLIHKNPVYLFGSASFKKLSKNFPESLNGQPVVFPTYDSHMRYKIEHWLQANSLRVDIVAETQDISLKTIMAVDGIGIIPATMEQVSYLTKQNKLYCLGKIPFVFEEIYLVGSDRKFQNKIAQELMKNFS